MRLLLFVVAAVCYTMTSAFVGREPTTRGNGHKTTTNDLLPPHQRHSSAAVRIESLVGDDNNNDDDAFIMTPGGFTVHSGTVTPFRSTFVEDAWYKITPAKASMKLFSAASHDGPMEDDNSVVHKKHDWTDHQGHIGMEEQRQAWMLQMEDQRQTWMAQMQRMQQYHKLLQNAQQHQKLEQQEQQEQQMQVQQEQELQQQLRQQSEEQPPKPMPTPSTTKTVSATAFHNVNNVDPMLARRLTMGAQFSLNGDDDNVSSYTPLERSGHNNGAAAEKEVPMAQDVVADTTTLEKNNGATAAAGKTGSAFADTDLDMSSVVIDQTKHDNDRVVTIAERIVNTAYGKHETKESLSSGSNTLHAELLNDEAAPVFSNSGNLDIGDSSSSNIDELKQASAVVVSEYEVKNGRDEQLTKEEAAEVAKDADPIVAMDAANAKVEVEKAPPSSHVPNVLFESGEKVKSTAETELLSLATYQDFADKAVAPVIFHSDQYNSIYPPKPGTSDMDKEATSDADKVGSSIAVGHFSENNNVPHQKKQKKVGVIDKVKRKKDITTLMEVGGLAAVLGAAAIMGELGTLTEIAMLGVAATALLGGNGDETHEKRKTAGAGTERVGSTGEVSTHDEELFVVEPIVKGMRNHTSALTPVH